MNKCAIGATIPHMPDPVPDRRAFSVAVFCRNGGEILLVRHKRLELWLPVGGEIEPGETPLEAARRELREETGLEGEFPGGLGVDGSPPGLIGYEEHPAGSKGLHLNFAFVADVPTRELAACEEYTAVRWVGDPVPVECPLNVRQLVRLALAAGREREQPAPPSEKGASSRH